MRQPWVSKSLGSATDLTLVADLREGMSQAGWEAISFASRAIAIMRVVNGTRAAREERQNAVFRDPIERVELLHSFRVALTSEPKPRLILSVAFDHHWEPYIRVVWRDLGPLLDPILCHCKGYPLAVSHPFEAYEAWVREVQVDTQWFYNQSQLTVVDLAYLTQVERELRENPDAREAGHDVAAMRARSPAEVQRKLRHEGLATPEEVETQALSALGAFHSLVRFYGADPQWDKNGPNDAALLHRLATAVIDPADLARMSAKDRAQHADMLQWIQRPAVIGPAAVLPDAPDLAQVQKGVLTGFADDNGAADVGVVLLLEVVQPQDARTWLAQAAVSTEADAGPGSDRIWRQIALGRSGLDRLELDAALVKALPQEFDEGSIQRAPQLGDQRGFHPRNWKWPQANWPKAEGPLGGPVGSIRPNAIDVVIQLRMTSADGNPPPEFDSAHPLYAAVKDIADTAKGLRLRGVIPMLSASAPHDRGQQNRGQQNRGQQDRGQVRDHFGLADGISQPVPDKACALAALPPAKAGDDPLPPPSRWTDAVPMGELLVGRAHRPDLVVGGRLGVNNHVAADPFQQDGSFLVIRRMRQHRDRFDRIVESAARQSRQDEDLVKAKMLGRWPSGKALITAVGDNGFTYSEDPEGRQCPLQSHVRRANPRILEGEQRTPRLMRRGMSYGPRVDADGANAEAERGVMFMAYCASIAEQYEVVQRWVNGGNSTRIASFHTDPLMGVPRRGDKATFRWPDKRYGFPYRVDLNRNDQPAVELEWTGYFFVPSVQVLRALESFAQDAQSEAAHRDAAEEANKAAQRLSDQLAYLRALEGQKPPLARQHWQALFDDAGMRAPLRAVPMWSAIRGGPDQLPSPQAPLPPHNPEGKPKLWQPGVLRCPYGTMPEESEGEEATRVIVGSRELFNAVLTPGNCPVSVSGYQARAKHSMGPIYLGMDDSSDYVRDSAAANAAISAVGFLEAWQAADGATKRVVEAIVQDKGGMAAIPLTALFDAVLAGLCSYYFNIPGDDGLIVAGGLDFRPVRKAPGGDGRPPRCPGDYYSPSRYMFDPTPSKGGVDMGKAHGESLKAHTEAMAKAGYVWNGPISGAIRTAIPTDNDLFARTLMGVMMGFLPTSFGNLIGIFQEWQDSGDLWRLQSDMDACTATDEPAPPTKGEDNDDVHDLVAKTGPAQLLFLPMLRAMQRRPAPDFIWRTATEAFTLGGITVKAGEVVALGIQAATLDAAANGDPDVYPIFGGNRDASAAPTHACPGYRMALGTLLGVCSGLLARADIRPASATLTAELRLRG